MIVFNFKFFLQGNKTDKYEDLDGFNMINCLVMADHGCKARDLFIENPETEMQSARTIVISFRCMCEAIQPTARTFITLNHFYQKLIFKIFSLH